MSLLSNLESRHGHRTAIGYDLHASFKELAERGEADVAIVSTEDGFSPLGISKEFFAADLGVPVKEISRLADWNRNENDRVTLAAISSQREGSQLRGIILAPGSNTRSYQPFVRSYDPRPNRNFYYNVSYEAIVFACRKWGARKLAISHLSSSGQYHEDIATCHMEALGHFCDGDPEHAPESFMFCGCCINPDHLRGIQRLNAEGSRKAHRSITVEQCVDGPAILLHLNW
ncbi:MAG: hypothetical protein Q8M20_14510 [Rhodocyclaceae bacterium]|nr:hypothetical protein [Rhodocyclaceae bacterium]MDZ4216212.1 hypothetical protein [Rhodocyclaceae bacterium]